MLAPAAGKIGTISHLAREPVRVDDESFFSRIAIAGKHFPEKLFTSSHNSQNVICPSNGPTASTYVCLKSNWTRLLCAKPERFSLKE
jgi:hypothetical protein